MLLVTAAHGNQGKLLIPRLVAAGAAVRACVRSDESSRALRAAGVAEVVVGDIADPQVLARAMHGVAEVYYIGPTLHPQEREMGLAAIDAARAAGVRHFVYSSVLHAILIDSDVFTKTALGTDDLSRFPYRTRAAEPAAGVPNRSRVVMPANWCGCRPAMRRP